MDPSLRWGDGEVSFRLLAYIQGIAPNCTRLIVGDVRTNMLTRRVRLLLLTIGAAAVALPTVMVEVLERGQPPLYTTLGTDGRYVWAPPPPGTFREVKSERGVEIATGILITCRVPRFDLEAGVPEVPNVFRANVRELDADQLRCILRRAGKHHVSVSFTDLPEAIWPIF